MVHLKTYIFNRFNFQYLYFQYLVLLTMILRIAHQVFLQYIRAQNTQTKLCGRRTLGAEIEAAAEKYPGRKKGKKYGESMKAYPPLHCVICSFTVMFPVGGTSLIRLAERRICTTPEKKNRLKNSRMSRACVCVVFFFCEDRPVCVVRSTPGILSVLRISLCFSSTHGP